MKSRQLTVAAGVSVAALALAPVALGGNHTVQVAGQLVAPSQVSAVQSTAATPAVPRIVQIGGKVVRPENLSATERQLSASYASASRTSEGQSWWKIGGISVAALAITLLVGTMLMNRRTLRPANA